jgi:phosphinothricin acetyltransferase
MGQAGRVRTELVVRDARPDDAGAISELFAVYVRTSVLTFELHPPSPQAWLLKLAAVVANGWPFLVGTLAGEVIGYAYVSPWRSKPAYDHTVEDTIYLAPNHTGHGFGRQLLTELLKRAATAGARQVIAVIASGDPASTALHERAGFEEVGRLRRVGFKHGQWIDTTLMQRDGIIERQAIHRGTFGSVRDLTTAIRTYINGWNNRAHPFVWTKTADQVLKKANRQTTSNAHH